MVRYSATRVEFLDAYFGDLVLVQYWVGPEEMDDRFGFEIPDGEQLHPLDVPKLVAAIDEITEWTESAAGAKHIARLRIKAARENDGLMRSASHGRSKKGARRASKGVRG